MGGGGVSMQNKSDYIYMLKQKTKLGRCTLSHGFESLEARAIRARGGGVVCGRWGWGEGGESLNFPCLDQHEFHNN